MLKSADLHETILTPVICHKHVRCHDGVTLYFSVKFLSVAPKRREIDIFPLCQQISAHSEVKTTEKKRGLQIAQIPMKEGAALGIWMICTKNVCCSPKLFSLRNTAKSVLLGGGGEIQHLSRIQLEGMTICPRHRHLLGRF